MGAAKRAAAELPVELLERGAELSLLAESVRRIENDEGGLMVLVAGEAGSGKTALVQRACEVHRGDSRVLRGACDNLFTPRPLGPVVDIAEQLGGEVEQLVERGAVAHEVATAVLRDWRAGPPCVCVIDDVHWADEATLDVIRLIARRIHTVPAILAITYRDDEVDWHHPLRRVLGELPSSSDVVRIVLRPLSRSAVEDLAVSHGVDPAVLYRKTSGNPFFVVEALEAGVEGVPDTVRDAVLARAARLGKRARPVLEIVSILPPHADPWLLASLGVDATQVDECVTAGMLTSDAGAIGYRHDLARLAIEESIAPTRLAELHRGALAAFSSPPAGAPDLARLAHHAEAAGDTEAVLRYAPAAARRASELGAHREAAAQYARALRFADHLDAPARVGLLAGISDACLTADDYDAGIAALEQEVELHRTLDDALGEGDALRRLSAFLWCPGRAAESTARAAAAVEILEALPASRELAHAYNNLAFVHERASRSDEATRWVSRSVALAEQLGEPGVALDARATLGVANRDLELLDEGLSEARRLDDDPRMHSIFTALATVAVDLRDATSARTHLAEGVSYYSEHGIELDLLYVLAHRARFELYTGQWDQAAATADRVLRIPRTSTTPRIIASVVLALVRARRGDPGAVSLLDEAWALAEPTSEVKRMAPVAAARAEVAWLAGDLEAIEPITRFAYQLATTAADDVWAPELGAWRRRAGIDDPPLERVRLEPRRLELAGMWQAAAGRWLELESPYEAALALAETGKEDDLRQSLELLLGLDARPLAGAVANRLRALGARSVPARPRGPRRSTLEHPAGLTVREQEVLELLVEGLPNRTIADQLVLSARTVDHHVAAILRKLGAKTRGEAARRAASLDRAAQA